jgi:hypothetical protein
VFDRTGRVVPVFIDKHLADTWEDANWIHESARRRDIPLMAGSSLPVLWRRPAADVDAHAPLAEIVAVSYHTLDAYGFHALEMVQSLAEQRAGGETGISRVQCLTGGDVWEAGEDGRYDPALLRAALLRLTHPITDPQVVRTRVREPVLFLIEYRDGLRAAVLTLNGAVSEWAVAWRHTGEDGITATLFWTQEARPFMHFTYLLSGIEALVHTGRPAWPVERTLLTSGALDALLVSKLKGGRPIETPHLLVAYETAWRWHQPPPPPPGRPIHGP